MILNIKIVKEIQELLISSYLPKSKIASNFGIDKNIINNIDNGIRNYNPNLSYPLRKVKEKTKVSYHITSKSRAYPIPSYEELLKTLYELKNAEKAAQKYNISQILFKKWCRSYRINPQHRKEYIEKYEVEFLGKKPKKKRPCLKILQIDPNTNKIINVFESCADASNKLKLPKTSINDNLDKNKLYAGYYWKRSNEKGNRFINQK